MKIHIRFYNGRWLVNDKILAELNSQERLFMDSFFRETKLKSIQLENYILHNGDKRI